MNVCSVHLYVVQIPSAQISWEVTIARVWMDSLQQFQVSPSASITHVQVNPTIMLYFKYNMKKEKINAENTPLLSGIQLPLAVGTLFSDGYRCVLCLFFFFFFFFLLLYFLPSLHN